jgi:hypothetical protein
MIRKKKARIDHFAGIKYDYPPVTSADQVKAVITARNAKNKHYVVEKYLCQVHMQHIKVM